MSDDRLQSLLSALPRVAPDADLTDEVQRRALRALADAQPAHPTLTRLWERVLVPTLLTATSAAYLFWAFSFCAGVYR